MEAIFAADIDGTLTEPGEPLGSEVTKKLVEIVNSFPVYLVLSSGKPTTFMGRYVKELMDYDASVLQRLVITGNNGGESLIVLDASMQARKVLKYDVNASGAEKAVQQLNEVGGYLSRKHRDKIREQGNVVDDQRRRIMYTAFPSPPLTPSDLERDANHYIQEHFGDSSEIVVLRHIDAIDIIPRPKNGIQLDKGTSIREVAKELAIPTIDLRRGNEQLFSKVLGIGYGDGSNDLQLFYAIAANVCFERCRQDLKAQSIKVVSTTMEGLDFIHDYFNFIFDYIIG